MEVLLRVIIRVNYDNERAITIYGNLVVGNPMALYQIMALAQRPPETNVELARLMDLSICALLAKMSAFSRYVIDGDIG